MRLEKDMQKKNMFESYETLKIGVEGKAVRALKRAAGMFVTADVILAVMTITLFVTM